MSNLFERCSAFLISALLLTATTVRAQVAHDNRAGLTFGGGVAFTHRAAGSCGGDGGGLEASGGVVVRPRGFWVIEGDFRAASLATGDCVTSVRYTDTTYAPSVFHNPYVASTVRTGIETPAGLPLIRLTAGAGIFLAGRATPFAAFDAVWSTRGTSARVFVAAEWTVARISGLEERYVNLDVSTISTRPIHTNVTSGAFRVGVELPVGQRNDR
jgi:hypothetical protein